MKFSPQIEVIFRRESRRESRREKSYTTFEGCKTYKNKKILVRKSLPETGTYKAVCQRNFQSIFQLIFQTIALFIQVTDLSFTVISDFALFLFHQPSIKVCNEY